MVESKAGVEGSHVVQEVSTTQRSEEPVSRMTENDLAGVPISSVAEYDESTSWFVIETVDVVALESRFRREDAPKLYLFVSIARCRCQSSGVRSRRARRCRGMCAVPSTTGRPASNANDDERMVEEGKE